MTALTQIAITDDVACLTLNRPAKRNALSDALVLDIEQQMQQMPDSVKAIVIHGAGEHFCAGLDLSEIRDRDVIAGMQHSRLWHRVFERIQYSSAPVIAAIHGACVGGGLELASACHIRVADSSAFFALPEGSRGIYVGGGGSVRIQKLIGMARMADMMLCGRVYNATEAERYNFVQYGVDAGEALSKATSIAQRIAQNAPMTNFAITNALNHIGEMAPQQGLFTESLISSIVQSAPAAKARLTAFLEGRADKVKRHD